MTLIEFQILIFLLMFLTLLFSIFLTNKCHLKKFTNCMFISSVLSFFLIMIISILFSFLGDFYIPIPLQIMIHFILFINNIMIISKLLLNNTRFGIVCSLLLSSLIAFTILNTSSFIFPYYSNAENEINMMLTEQKVD